MHFLYVDESGDTGVKRGSSAHFILCGLLIHHGYWHQARRATMAMRQRLEDKFGFPQQAELHASEFLSKNGMHFGLPLEIKIKCALHAVGFLRKTNHIRPIRIIADKASHDEDVFRHAWAELLAKANDGRAGDNRCPANGLIVICDDHRTAPASSWLEWVKSELDIGRLLADQPFGRDSKASDFLQACDLLAYLTKQTIEPAGFFRQNKSRWLTKRCDRLFSDPALSISIK